MMNELIDGVDEVMLTLIYTCDILVVLSSSMDLFPVDITN